MTMGEKPGLNSSSGSHSPPPTQGSTTANNGSSPSPPQTPPPGSKAAPAPSTNSPPASPQTPPLDSGSSPPSPPPSPPQNSTPPTPTPSPPPPATVTPPNVSPPPAPASTSPPPSPPSPSVSPPQPTTPPSGSSPPAQQLPPPTFPPPSGTPVVPAPYSPPYPASSGPPSPTVPSSPLSPPSPTTSNPSGSPSTPTTPTTPTTPNTPTTPDTPTNPSSPNTPTTPTTPTTPGSNPSPQTGNSPTEGSGSFSPKSGSTPRSSSASSTSTSSKPNTTSTTGIAIGMAVASVVIIAIIATAFVFCRRKKKRVGSFAPQYMPPNNFSMPADTYYYGQKPHPADSVYASQIHHSPMMNNSPVIPNGYSGGPYSGGGFSEGGYSGGGYSTGGPETDVIGGGKSFFSYEEVMEITNGFCRQNVIGEGGFGCVYKGQLPDGRLVAVKQLKAGSGQGDREFRAEVEIISRVHHRHLVSLVGYSITEKQRLLIYEFVPNKTLDYHLHGKGLPVLDWSKRVKIALGSAKGLAYLHEDCHPKIIHRDIKSSNILLDDAYEAQVADFGLAKLTNDTKTHVSTRVMGTFGYLAPEYASSGKLTDRSDVFSFGVVLLELLTGRKPVDPSQPLGDESLVEWARPHLIHALETGEFSELVDPRLENHYVETEVFRMIEAAAACIRHNAAKRPRMAQVVRALDNESNMSDLTNGVKFGQSTAYDSEQYSEDIKRFNRMALGADDSSDYGTYTGDYSSREVPSETQSSWKSRDTSCGYTSGESETRAINPERRSRMGSRSK